MGLVGLISVRGYGPIQKVCFYPDSMGLVGLMGDYRGSVGWDKIFIMFLWELGGCVQVG